MNEHSFFVKQQKGYAVIMYTTAIEEALQTIEKAAPTIEIEVLINSIREAMQAEKISKELIEQVNTMQNTGPYEGNWAEIFGQLEILQKVFAGDMEYGFEGGYCDHTGCYGNN